MSRARLVLVLCLIVLTQTACARRSARAVRIPPSHAASVTQKPARDAAAKEVRDTIGSLKDRLGAQSGKADETPTGTSTAVVPHGTATGNPKQVGTGGAWSVETRYPVVQSEAPSGGAGSPPGRLLSRAGEAVRHAGSGTWAGVLALCVAAAALVALAVRRARTSP